MPPRVSTGDRDAVLRWCAAVQTMVNCHCQLEENPVGNVEPTLSVVSVGSCVSAERSVQRAITSSGFRRRCYSDEMMGLDCVRRETV